MRSRRFAILFAVVFVFAFGATACGGGEEAQVEQRLEQLEQQVEEQQQQLEEQQKLLDQQIRETMKEEEEQQP